MIMANRRSDVVGKIMEKSFCYAADATILHVFLPKIENDHMKGSGASQKLKSICQIPVRRAKPKVAFRKVPKKVAKKGGIRDVWVHPMGPMSGRNRRAAPMEDDGSDIIIIRALDESSDDDGDVD